MIKPYLILKNLSVLTALIIWYQNVSAQNIFNAVYPIGDNPTVAYKTNMKNIPEEILFEANPILRMPLYNNIARRLTSGKLYSSGSTLYLGFKPQFRMYNQNSKPVKTPSYKISILGFQYVKRLPEVSFAKGQLLAFSVESGHYSNGQSGCTYSKNFDDNDAGCEIVYSQITPATNLSNLLNRESGNFSTNYTEVIVNYRLITALDEDYKPTKSLSVKLGLNRYHNKLLFLADLGGYNENDIKIYGKNRFLGGVEYLFSADRESAFNKKLKIDRFSNSLNVEYIDTPHPFVNPWRIELTSTVYLKNNLGVFIGGIYGHDNYNMRFVDSGKQFTAGITFDIFPPIEIK